MRGSRSSLRVRGTRGGAGVPYVPDATPEASLDPLLTDYLRRELEKIQDALSGNLTVIADLAARVEALELAGRAIENRLSMEPRSE